MVAGLYARCLSGACLVTPTRVCLPFKEICVHTLTSSPSEGSGTSAGTHGCLPNTTIAGTYKHPVPSIPSALSYHPLYGRTTGSVALPGHFKTADLAPWRSRRIRPGGPYPDYTSGPAVVNTHQVTMLRRRLRPDNDTYANRYGFAFTDAGTALNGMGDWLGHMHPADFFWTNKGLTEPFLAVNNYEQTGQNPTATDSYNQRFTPFCSPMPVYNSAGTTLLGTYVGYTWVYYFARSYLVVPVDPYRPEDYYSALTVKPKVTATQQFFSLDAHLYMVSDTPATLISPRLQSARYWVYNKDGTTWNVCDPYLYMLCGDATSAWSFDVQLSLVGGASETIQFGLTNLLQYVTP